MIELVGTGFTITPNMVYAVCIFSIVGMLQPWSRTWKCIGAMIGMVAYAMLPFVIAARMSL